ncbi:MAG: WG repeat-containing protein [Coriobacteriales bacterium]|nr:WG repeat-containing protein [Coriobacteriales bacterium]
MKGYAKFAPLALVLLFVVAIYSVVNTEMQTVKNYEQALLDARKYAADGIVVDAIKSYEAALAINESLPIRVEAGETLFLIGSRSAATFWAKDLIKRYPLNPESYEFTLKLYYETKNYAAFFEQLDIMKGREVNSSIVDDMVESLRYAYFFDSSYEDVALFSDDICAIKKKEKWGFVAKNGKKLTNSTFLAAGSFVNGLAPVTNESNDAFFVDAKGDNKSLIARGLGAKQFGMFSADILPVYDGEQWCYYTSKGELLHGGYQNATAYSSSGVAAVYDGDGWYLVNKDGTAISSNRYDDIAINELGVAFAQDRACAYKDGAVVILDADGNELFSTYYENAHPFGTDGLAAVSIGGAWGFINKDGEMVIEAQYLDAHSFHNGFAAVNISGRWGFINIENMLIIEANFTDAKDFSAGGSVFIQDGSMWKLLRFYSQSYA